MELRNSFTAFLHQGESNLVLQKANKEIREQLPENYIRISSTEIVVKDTIKDSDTTLNNNTLTFLPRFFNPLLTNETII